MHNCMKKKRNCGETQGSIMTKGRFGQRNRNVKQAHWENLTCCLASHMQKVKAIYFCSVNCFALESLVLDYPLARRCPNSEQCPWCVIRMKKKSKIQGELNKYRGSETLGHGGKSAMCVWVGRVLFSILVVSDTSTTAVSKTSIGAFLKLFGKYINKVFFPYKVLKFDSMHKRTPIGNKGIICTTLQLYNYDKTTQL